ncbi:hypothetical protein C0Q70_16968 [Pomacea canaliculata]|uniref:Uncharacterized protein n=1 Tax=Pomacea canaliculata TaxID=400727 RepID=A0A2T7NR90_POMCA|nr:hypothetical protein C0Q70_16968 [Pomacea canaliculata]
MRSRSLLTAAGHFDPNPHRHSPINVAPDRVRSRIYKRNSYTRDYLSDLVTCLNKRLRQDLTLIAIQRNDLAKTNQQHLQQHWPKPNKSGFARAFLTSSVLWIDVFVCLAESSDRYG